jgi:HD-like signal output (HDOD) protein/CheY-like chemotaxis protein
MKRILFVDDDSNVLTGLRNVLRPRRHEWEMVFALGPEEALARIAQTKFDVVVSDMRMPSMDGATLLAKIKQLQPQAVRMILSGQTELESVMKSVFIAHMFLSKPCDPVFLQNVIERACRLNTIVNSDELRAIVGTVSMLPSAPQTYLALNEALLLPTCSVVEVARIIERDIGLCAKLLQLVNSAFFGLPRRISTLSEAVTYLGTATIKNLAMAIEAFSVGAETSGLSEPAMLALQAHSLLTGEIARQIEKPDKKLGEEAFLAGILHEVGWLVRVNEAAAADACLTVDRALLGAYLLGLWGLPHVIMETVAYHRAPHLLPHATFELVDAVYIADHLAAEIEGNHAALPALDLGYLAGLGVDSVRLAEMRVLAKKAMVRASST